MLIGKTKYLLVAFCFIGCTATRYDYQMQARLIEVTSKKGNKWELKFLSGKDTIYYKYKGKMAFIKGDLYTIRYNGKDSTKSLPSEIRHNN